MFKDDKFFFLLALTKFNLLTTTKKLLPLLIKRLVERNCTSLPPLVVITKTRPEDLVVPDPNDNHRIPKPGQGWSPHTFTPPKKQRKYPPELLIY